MKTIQEILQQIKRLRGIKALRLQMESHLLGQTIA
jgi:hypothetical protein